MFFLWTEIKHYKISPNVIVSHCLKWQGGVDGEEVGGKAGRTRTSLAIIFVGWQ